MARMTPAVMRALDILELFLGGDESLTAADVMAATDLPKTSVHELLTTLTSRGYLDREPGGHYQLGVRLLHLGHAYTARFDLLAAASELARTVATDTGETCSVAVLQDNEVFYLAKVDGTEVLQLASGIGKRLPASATGLGKALLSALPPSRLKALYPDGALPVLTPHSHTTLAELEPDLQEARDTGVAYEREESTHGLACAATLIRDVSGNPVAAVSIAVPLARWDRRPKSFWAGIVVEAAARVSAELGNDRVRPNLVAVDQPRASQFAAAPVPDRGAPAR